MKETNIRQKYESSVVDTQNVFRLFDLEQEPFFWENTDGGNMYSIFWDLPKYLRLLVSQKEDARIQDGRSSGR